MRILDHRRDKLSTVRHVEPTVGAERRIDDAIGGIAGDNEVGAAAADHHQPAIGGKGRAADARRADDADAAVAAETRIERAVGVEPVDRRALRIVAGDDELVIGGVDGIVGEAAGQADDTAGSKPGIKHAGAVDLGDGEGVAAADRAQNSEAAVDLNDVARIFAAQAGNDVDRRAAADAECRIECAVGADHHQRHRSIILIDRYFGDCNNHTAIGESRCGAAIAKDTTDLQLSGAAEAGVGHVAGQRQADGRTAARPRHRRRNRQQRVCAGNAKARGDFGHIKNAVGEFGRYQRRRSRQWQQHADIERGGGRRNIAGGIDGARGDRAGARRQGDIGGEAPGAIGDRRRQHHSARPQFDAGQRQGRAADSQALRLASDIVGVRRAIIIGGGKIKACRRRREDGRNLHQSCRGNAGVAGGVGLDGGDGGDALAKTGDQRRAKRVAAIRIGDERRARPAGAGDADAGGGAGNDTAKGESNAGRRFGGIDCPARQLAELRRRRRGAIQKETIGCGAADVAQRIGLHRRNAHHAIGKARQQCGCEG